MALNIVIGKVPAVLEPAKVLEPEMLTTTRLKVIRCFLRIPGRTIEFITG